MKIYREEVQYCAILLAGNRYYNDNKNYESDINNVDLYVNLMLRKIFDSFKIDFFLDKELKNDLSLHIIAFIKRVNNNILINNPILYNIKRSNSFAYEIASIGVSALHPYLKGKVSEDEISYFALYFILALERMKSNNKLEILVVSNIGIATSKLLSYQIKERYGNQIKNITILSAQDFYNEDINKYDYILSTVPLKNNEDKIIHINNLLNEQDYNKINQIIYSNTKKKKNLTEFFDKNKFFTITSNNKMDALKQLCYLSENNEENANQLFESVIERENIASTELTNLIAIPHPITPLSSATYVSIALLNKPIIWQEKYVQLIILICISENNIIDMQNLYSSIYELVKDENTSSRISEVRDFDTFLNLFQN